MDSKQLEEKLNEAMDDNAQPIVPETPVEPEKIKVGEDEYTQDELNRYVGLGKLGAEMEDKWNTKIDAVYPNYTKSREEIKTLQEQLEEAKSKIPQTPETPDAEQSKEALRILKEQFGVVTKDEFKQMLQEERETEKLSSQVTTLGKEIDGTDGRPAFNPVDVLTFMRDEGIKDPMKAYKVMHEDKLDAWKAEKLVKGDPKDPIISVTKATAGGKQPNSVRPTVANLQQMLEEALPDR